jgi:hypothetical protein
MNAFKLILSTLVLLSIACQAQSQSNPNIVATDPAIAEMELSLDMPRPSANQGAVTSTPATSTPAAATPPVSSAAGIWHLTFSEGQSLDLSLQQSGAVLFGRGNITSGGSSQWTTASGAVSGSILRLDVVPASGDVLYAASLDLSRLPVSGTYLILRSGTRTVQGTVQAGRE